MARTQVYIKLDGTVNLWKADLKGHGPVRIGEEFTARQMHQFGKARLVRNGQRLKVRVVAIGPPPLEALSVEVL